MIDPKKLTPAPGYLLINPDQEEKTDSGIYLPDSADKKSQTGTVLALGAPEQTEKGKQESPAQKGQKVVYKKWGGTEFSQGPGKEELLFIKFEDVVAVVA